MIIVFYDEHCGFCSKIVSFICRRDTKGQFFFAPLDGKTAKKHLQEFFRQHPGLDSVIVKDEEHIYIYSKAVFFLLHRLGGFYRIIGSLFYLPSWLFDGLYRLVARWRRSCKLKSPLEPNEHFLP